MATLRIPVRLPDAPHHPPRLAVHVGRVVSPRHDLIGRPLYVRDTIYMDDNDCPRIMQCAALCRDERFVTPPAEVVSYRFPYARSKRGAITWRRAFVNVKTGDLPHAC